MVNTEWVGALFSLRIQPPILAPPPAYNRQDSQARHFFSQKNTSVNKSWLKCILFLFKSRKTLHKSKITSHIMVYIVPWKPWKKEWKCRRQWQKGIASRMESCSSASKCGSGMRVSLLDYVRESQVWELLSYVSNGRNNSQRCWMLHVASHSTPFCMLLGVATSVCTPLPTRTQQLPSQHCWPNNVGSCCCVRLHVALPINSGGSVFGRAFFVVVVVVLFCFFVCLFLFFVFCFFFSAFCCTVQILLLSFKTQWENQL